MTSTSIDFGLTLAHSAKQENPIEHHNTPNSPSSENMRKILNKIYEEQNSEKIKIASEIINRSVF
jgi:hypothetical protein